ncbi:reticulocyte-binding protein homolog 1-like [Melitaea cinxia]|uniref:reticulocyte-binding protein homolog 1-like n=1 Tax=Melitaea cinxia TaxID=113334 RepID=UPI001E2720B9|nr:reticulocyte-binding protein homolog 1-like [Melitaea cinxia]
MFALLLLVQHLLLLEALGRDTSKDTFIVKQIDVCPDVGYFFKRDLNSNTIEPSCHLCFCQNNGTAICWSRENRRCDEKHYYHTGKKKTDVRSRRSPGFSDVFFRDATRDIFNKQIPEQCKPFESSFSEGCPPADWCTGCTVCDCDANGRWDCHILSFCPDRKDKKGKPNALKAGKVINGNTNSNDSTVKFAQTFLKKVMASVEKIVTESQKNLVKAKQTKNIQKRSMSKNYRKDIQKNSSDRDTNKVQSKIINNINTKLRKNLSKKKATDKLIIHSRRKREITTNEIKSENNTLKYLSTISNSSTTRRYDYYKYEMDLKNVTLTKHNNSITTERNDEQSTLNNTFSKTIGMTVIPKGLIFNKLQNSLTSLNTEKNRQEIFGVKSNYSNDNGYYFSFNTTNYKENLTCGKFCDLKKTLKKYIGISNKRNSTEAKIQHLNILTNLKKIFRQVFFKSKVKSRSSTIEKLPFRKRYTIKLLCKSIDNCKINHTTKELQYKLEKLRAEGLNILKSARIIKGLLRLLNSENGKTNRTYISKQFTDNDINKLNLILTGEFEARYGLMNVTETQRTQMNYIKENIYVLIRSIENFARILNDVINILANGNRRMVEHRYAGKHKTIKENRNAIVTDKLEKLKNLLTNYNLVQNKFIKRMYEVLNTLENNGKNMTGQIKVSKVSAQNKKFNNTIAIENYTKNIFENLRKLKDLVVRLNSKNRKKRSIMDEGDALEYLLTLMEYLFKKNQPLNVTPVNDGIDLLIEAIKNAPDIKLTKKKVLNNDLTQMRKTNTIITAHADNEITESNASSSLFENKLKTFESIDEEHEEFNNSINTNFNRNIYQNSNDIDDLHKEFNNVKKYEIFIDDTDEDESFPDTTTIIVETEASITEPTRTLSPNKKETNSNDYETNDSKNRIKLEWVEENINNNEPEKLSQPKETTTQMSQLVTRTVKANDKYADPISSMSQEDSETGFKNKEADESYKRQLNLLNSIDYGTEKSFVDSESREDKYNVESSPLYFV